MSFSQATISNVRVDLDGPELFISWSCSAPGSPYQVYVDRRLSWSGLARRCLIPLPPGSSGRNVWVDVGTVAPDEAAIDFSSSLPAATSLTTRAMLTWKGGTYLDSTGLDDIRGFRIYGSPAPGASVDYTRVLTTVAAYPGGWISDGFGMGGFGDGGFGRAASTYQWQSTFLASGNWSFAVVPYDQAGNARGTGQLARVAIQEAPLPPALPTNGFRLAYQYSGPASRLATLTWQPSPSAG
jgi:hypothetical protein